MLVLLVITGTTAQNAVIPFDFVIFLPAGQSLVSETDANIKNVIVSKQIADINGNLTSPS